MNPPWRTGSPITSGKCDLARKTSRRNGIRAKAVLTDVGPVEVNAPRCLEGSFEPPA
ncbi:transposase [Streptomyces sp. KK5PA1]|uniref:Transposase n=1 Tax=Actinacidiphila acididurans TaxID=2784346 RepID=A0ABS2U691_9ACTN|nr:transposase [Actinacidiphila acididurans]